MSKIIEFRNAKAVSDAANAWHRLFAKEYFGGTRGEGKKYGKYCGNPVVCGLSIYYQETDAAANYHSPPIELEKVLGSLLINTKEGRALIVRAVKELGEKTKATAAEAAQEHAELLKAAGIA